MASSDQMSDGPPTKKAKMGGDAGKFAQFSFLKTPRKKYYCICIWQFISILFCRLFFVRLYAI